MFRFVVGYGMTYERVASYDDVKVTWTMRPQSGGRGVDLTVQGRLRVSRAVNLGARDWLPVLGRAYDRFEREVTEICDEIADRVRGANSEVEGVEVTYRELSHWEAENGAIIFWSSPSLEFGVSVDVTSV